MVVSWASTIFWLHKLTSTMPSPFSFLRSSKRHVAGTVDRIGPWHGPAEINGIVLTLKNDPQVNVVLRDDQRCTTPAGLTRPGDAVSFAADRFGTVNLSSEGGMDADAPS